MAAPPRERPAGASSFPQLPAHAPPTPKRFPARRLDFTEQPSGEGLLGAAAGRWWLETARIAEECPGDRDGSRLLWAGESKVHPDRDSLRSRTKQAWSWAGERTMKADSSSVEERRGPPPTPPIVKPRERSAWIGSRLSAAQREAPQGLPQQQEPPVVPAGRHTYLQEGSELQK